MGVEVGTAAEDATRSAAATFGLPDLVFRSAHRSIGSGTRELGDAIIVVGGVAAAVQVKARAAASGQYARERAWLDKRIEKAARQARGTIRMMIAAYATLVNERGRAVQISGPSKSWVPVVIVDHPGPPNAYTPALTASTAAVVPLRRDWEFLFEQLKSTDAVIRYLHRVSPMPASLSARSLSATTSLLQQMPSPCRDRWIRGVRPGMKSVSTPILPQAPAGFPTRHL
jgi:hypothetical protein